MKYLYRISGYYWHGQNGIEVKDHFDEEIEAENNTDAMHIVVGRLACETSLNEETFILDCIHYEVLKKSPYEEPEFRRYVLEHCIDVPKEALEPFCPFEGIYCNSAYSASCLKCQEALKAYLK